MRLAGQPSYSQPTLIIHLPYFITGEEVRAITQFHPLRVYVISLHDIIAYLLICSY